MHDGAVEKEEEAAAAAVQDEKTLTNR